MRKPRRIVSGSVWGILALVHTGFAVVQDEAVDPAPAEVTTEQESIETLRAIELSLRTRRATLEARRGQLAGATTEEDRARLAAEVQKLQGEVRQLEASFEALATGLDLEALGDQADQEFSLRSEVESLLRPMLRELRAATEDPRRIDRLRNEVELLGNQLEMVDLGIQRIDHFLAEAEAGGALHEGLTGERKDWADRRDQLQSKMTVTRHQLRQKLDNRKSLLESTQTIAGDFFKTRGLNLGSSLFAFLAVFIGLRYVYYRVLRVGRRASRSFLGRLITVLFFFFAFIAAVLASLLVLYVAGDWVLLGLALILLFGLAWTSRRALPHVLEDVRMLVNLGPVRENERLVLDGVPWHVASLNVYTTLRNPALTGGEIRLPVRLLSTMHSRPLGSDELWFPCRADDWVLLEDGKRGKVVYQSPEFVQLVELGGARVTYPTAGFLAMNPRNLSAGFRLSVTFGIDYQHQADSTTEVPAAMQAALEGGLARQVDPRHIHRVNVEFKEAGASSLDYAALVDVDGTLAPRYAELTRATQRILVDTCNRHGWVIPFTQVTLHQATPPG